jgi:hypothetical protein
VTAVAAGQWHSLALRSNGTVAAWGCGRQDNGQCSVPRGLSDVTAVAAGGRHSLGLKRDGTVVAWGCRGANLGQCSVPGGLSRVTAVAAGAGHSLALNRDGTVVAWGCRGANVGQCSVPGGLSGVTAIAAGTYHSLAMIDPSAWCKVPRVVGVRLRVARRNIRENRCRIGKVLYRVSRTRRRGVVISQRPRAGSTLPVHSKIDLVVSRGPV